MKWYYGACLMIRDAKDGITPSTSVYLIPANSSREAVGVVMESPFYKDSLKEKFTLNGSPAMFEIPADTVRQMATDYGILPEGGGK